VLAHTASSYSVHSGSLADLRTVTPAGYRKATQALRDNASIKPVCTVELLQCQRKYQLFTGD